MVQSAINTVIVFQVRRRLSEIFAQAQAEIETLKKTENELRMGQSKLEDLGRRLDQEQVEFSKISYWTFTHYFFFLKLKNEVERSIASLKERNSELEDSLGKLKSQDKNFDVDEAVVTTAPIYKQ